MVLLSLVSFNQNDPSLNHAVSNATAIKNNAGLFGAYISGLLVDIFGLSAFVWPAVFIAWGAGFVSTWFTMPWWRWCGFVLLAACLVSLGAAWNLGIGDVRGGGMLGMALYREFTALFNPVGATLIWLFLLFISLELAFGIEWLGLIRKGWATVQPLFGDRLKSWESVSKSFATVKSRVFMSQMPFSRKKEQGKDAEETTESVDVIPLFELHKEPVPPVVDPPLTLSPQNDTPERNMGQTESEKKKRTFNLAALLSLTAPEKKPGDATSETNASPLELKFDFDAPQETGDRTPPKPEAEEPIPAPATPNAPAPQRSSEVTPATQPQTTPPREQVTASIPQPPVLHKRKYPMPPLDLLQQPQESDSLPSPAVLAAQSEGLMTCLGEFNIQGELVKVTPGPVITLFEIRPAPGVRVGRFTNLTDDLARSLKAEAIRIQAPVPGSDTVGVEIPNVKRSTVNFRALVQSDAFRSSSSLLTMALGKDIEGRPAVRDLATMPHVLVAGTTGSGKSVCLNSILVSFLYKASPDDVKLMLVDPKRVEMAMYADLPHLVHPVVTETSLAKTALDWAVHEMDQRYDCLARFGVKNIKDYNKKLESFGPEVPPQFADLKPMPYLVIVIDELADLMLTAGKDVEGCIVRLAQLARAAGIHLIVATQRPSVDVVTGLIKANFPCRISFQVANKYDSRTILDTAGAEQLLGKGDMLFKPTGGKLQRLHGPFVTDEEVQAVVDYWKRQKAPQYEVDFSEWGASVAEPAKAGAISSGSVSSEEEALYAEAVAFVQEQGRMSISLLQRRFRIGFNKAARFVERMEQDGILPPASRANKARQVRTD